MGVKDPWRYPKFLCGCKRLIVLLPERENTRSCYQEDLELSDRSRE